MLVGAKCMAQGAEFFVTWRVALRRGQGIGLGIFNDNIDENQTTTNPHGLQDQGMSKLGRPMIFNDGGRFHCQRPISMEGVPGIEDDDLDDAAWKVACTPAFDAVWGCFSAFPVHMHAR